MPRRKDRKRDQDGIFERPDSPYWWASYTDSTGKATRRSTGVRRQDDPRKDAAKKVRAGWLLETKPKPTPPRKGPVFDELMVAYIDGPSLEKRSHARDLYSLRQLAKVFAGQPLEGLGRADVIGYIAKRQTEGVSPATINKETGLFRAALNWARRELEWRVPNPFEGRKLKEPAGRSRWLKPDEAQALLDAAQAQPKAPHLADFIRLGLYAGMRPGEILGLEWSRVDLPRNLLYLGSKDQKNGKEGAIPLNGKAREALISRARYRAEHCPGSPWVFCDAEGNRIASVKRSFATACRAALLEDVHPHDLRRTCGSWLSQAGVPIQAISALLRHSDVRVTEQIYAHLSQDSLRQAITVLDKEQVSRLGFTLTEKQREEVG